MASFNLITLDKDGRVHQQVAFSTTPTNVLHSKIKLGRPVTKVACSDDGQLIVVGDSLGFIYGYWLPERRFIIHHRLPSCVTALTLLSSENCLGINLVAASSKYNSLHFLNLTEKTCRELARIEYSHSTCINTLSSNGNLVLSSSPNDRSLLWHVEGLNVQKQLLEKKLKRVRFIGSSGILVERTTKQLFILDVNTFNLVKKIDNCLLLSPCNSSELLLQQKVHTDQIDSAHREDKCNVHCDNFVIYDEFGSESKVNLDLAMSENYCAKGNNHLPKLMSKVISNVDVENKDQEGNYFFLSGEFKNKSNDTHYDGVIGLRQLTTNWTLGKRARSFSKGQSLYSLLIQMPTPLPLMDTGSGFFLALDSHGHMVTSNNNDLSSLRRVRFSFLQSPSRGKLLTPNLIGISVNGDLYIMNLPHEYFIKGTCFSGQKSLERPLTATNADWSKSTSHTFDNQHQLHEQLDCRGIIKDRVTYIAKSILVQFGRFPMKYRLFLWKWLLDPLVEFDECPCHHSLTHPCKLALKVIDFLARTNRLPHGQHDHLECTLSQLVHWDESLVQSIDSLWQVLRSFSFLFASVNRRDEKTQQGTNSLTLFKLVASVSEKGFLHFSQIHFAHVVRYVRCFIRSPLSTGCTLGPLADCSRQRTALCKSRYFNIALVNRILARAFAPLLPESHLLVLWDHLITKGLKFLYPFLAALFLVLQAPADLQMDNDENKNSHFQKEQERQLQLEEKQEQMILRHMASQMHQVTLASLLQLADLMLERFQSNLDK